MSLTKQTSNPIEAIAPWMIVASMISCMLPGVVLSLGGGGAASLLLLPPLSRWFFTVFLATPKSIDMTSII
jgi:hypothetical protein